MRRLIFQWSQTKRNSFKCNRLMTKEDFLRNLMQLVWTLDILKFNLYKKVEQINKFSISSKMQFNLCKKVNKFLILINQVLIIQQQIWFQQSLRLRKMWKKKRQQGKWKIFLRLLRSPFKSILTFQSNFRNR